MWWLRAAWQRARERDAEIAAYRAREEANPLGCAVNRLIPRSGYIRHVQNTTWWETLLGVFLTLALTYALGRLLVLWLISLVWG